MTFGGAEANVAAGVVPEAELSPVSTAQPPTPEPQAAPAEENVVDANLRLLQARANVERARVKVDRTSGALLERYDIDLGPELKPARGDRDARID